MTQWANRSVFFLLLQTVFLEIFPTVILKMRRGHNNGDNDLIYVYFISENKLQFSLLKLAKKRSQKILGLSC